MLSKSISFSLIVFALIVVSCGKKDQPASGPPPVAVTLQDVQAQQASYYDEYPAVLRAINEVELRPQVNGYITGIHFQEGARVSKGQKLYSIDQQSYEASYQQAVANLEVQQANLVRAQKDVDRYRELSKKDAIAKQQVDYAEATFSAAQQQVEAAKAAVRNVQTNVRYSSIVAPFDGRIGISAVRLGTSVSAGQTLLNTISADDPIAADITIDQREIVRFTALQNTTPRDSVFLLAFSGRTFGGIGKIAAIDRAVDAQTGTIRIRLTFPNTDLILRSGMNATLRVKATGDKRSIVIPFRAVTEQLGEFFVYVANDGKVSQRRVLLAQQIGTNIIISEGLTEGEKIAVEGVQNLREGAAIAVSENAGKK